MTKYRQLLTNFGIFDPLIVKISTLPPLCFMIYYIIYKLIEFKKFKIPKQILRKYFFSDFEKNIRVLSCCVRAHFLREQFQTSEMDPNIFFDHIDIYEDQQTLFSIRLLTYF